MGTLVDLMTRGVQHAAHRPWPRSTVDAATWNALGEALAAGRLTLVGLWGEAARVHMALRDDADFGVVSLECPSGEFPSVAALHQPAGRLERTIVDLFGLTPVAAGDAPLDRRPWLDHGRWGVRAPLGSRPAFQHDLAAATDYPFLPAEGEGLHEIPVGPVHAGIIEPGHFRFTAAGETVVRLEARLGYVHKGIEGLMAGSDLQRAARLAGRTSGDSTVSYALALARAAEAALGVDAPPRAHWLRALMAELERLANHFGDIGAVCNDAAFALLHAHCGMLRERVLRTAAAAFGHRLMRDRIVPGGVTTDLTPHGRQAIAALLEEVRQRCPAIVDLYENTASLQDRTVGTGVAGSTLVELYGAGGYVGRASGRAFDARRLPGYAPYDELRFEVPVLSAGDVNARVWIRIRELEQSAAIIGQILERMPDGPVDAPLPETLAEDVGEGAALIEAFRGDVLVWLALAPDMTVVRCHLRDPSWFQWPLLEVAIDGNIVADFPLCNKSFNCSYSGHDL